MQKIATFLWFNGNAEQAVKFYTSIFKNSKITKTSYYPESVAKNSGVSVRSVMTIAFKLNGQDFIALNGGSEFKFTEAISLLVYCDTQAELDRYWKKLTSGGGKGRGDRRDSSPTYTTNVKHAARGNTPRRDVKTRKR